MNVWKKVGALTFLVLVIFALNVTVFADNDPVDLTDGVASGTLLTTGSGTAFNDLERIVNLKKDIVVYNANEHSTASGTVAAPAFSYTYTVTAESSGEGTVSGKSITDKEGVNATTYAGVIKGLIILDSNAAGAAEGATEVSGTLSYANTEFFNAGPDGVTNTKDIPVDFSNVSFTKPGVYRYKIAETLKGSVAYNTLSMTDGNLNEVYLDVYVDGAGKIYGYVCLPTNEAAVTKDTTKINGFVRDTTNNGADSYYTYDLTLSKTVVGDNYAKANHAFPFTVFFKPQSDTMTTTFAVKEIINNNDTSGTVGFVANSGTTAINAASSTGWSGYVKIKSGASITYTGIPCGMDVTVYETNDEPNVTYKVTTTATGSPTSTVDNSVATSETSTAVTFDTTVATKVETAQSCAIENALVNISPTGVTLRYAPYLLTLGAGITVLPLTRRYKKREED